MHQKTKAIVLGVIKYNDNDAIIQTYTRENGFAGFFIKGFFKSGTKKLKKAYFQPANQLELVYSQPKKSKLQYLKEAKVWYHYKNIHNDFDKLNQSVFIREILLQTLTNEPPENELFQFITSTFIELDESEFNPDFHLIFLIRLTRFLGFSPSIETQGAYFDMQNGIFDNQMNFGQFLNQAESRLFKQFLGMIFANKNYIKINNSERKKLLQIMLDYYQIHIENFSIPKSIEVLQQMYQ